MKLALTVGSLLFLIGLQSISSSNTDGSMRFLPAETPPTRAVLEFDTDFTCHTIPYSEVLSGGPPKDGIPAVDIPAYESMKKANSWLTADEPVIVVQYRGKARVYPIQILMWHEIVNDVLEGLPVSVTYCPLCNTGIAFDRRMDGETLDFGTTGRLRYSNLIMYDRQSETWWQQATGAGVAGKWAGRQLTMLPTLTMSWKDAKSEFEYMDVLSRKTGYSRPYGQNPYVGYDNAAERPFLYQGPEPGSELRALERVMTLQVGTEVSTYANTRLMTEKVITDRVGDKNIVIIWQPGTNSSLDADTISEGRDVGSANAFIVEPNGPGFGMTYQRGAARDEKGNIWNTAGRAISGPDAGHVLQLAVAVQHFWFSASAFHSSETLRSGETLF